MLREAKQLLAERGPMTLRELARAVDMDTGAVEPMLRTLVDKGQVRVASAVRGKPCAGCTAACRDDMLVYELTHG